MKTAGTAKNLRRTLSGVFWVGLCRDTLGLGAAGMSLGLGAGKLWDEAAVKKSAAGHCRDVLLRIFRNWALHALRLGAAEMLCDSSW